MTTRHPVACPRCGEPFGASDPQALHLGRVHPDTLTEPERARFEEALEREEAWVGTFQRHVRGGMATLPILGLYLILVVGAGLVMDLGNPGLMFLPLPFTVGLSALVYYLGYTHHRPGEGEAA